MNSIEIKLRVTKGPQNWKKFKKKYMKKRTKNSNYKNFIKKQMPILWIIRQ